MTERRVAEACAAMLEAHAEELKDNKVVWAALINEAADVRSGAYKKFLAPAPECHFCKDTGFKEDGAAWHCGICGRGAKDDG